MFAAAKLGMMETIADSRDALWVKVNRVEETLHVCADGRMSHSMNSNAKRFFIVLPLRIRLCLAKL
jgi:hypothetical protein